ncbi:hypothetical protein B7494_g1206 [Chlorociboria aeruginascens]|nr:hypothetical protein B7494_g1206 [Chlorociboria aeruginascens]
MSNIPPSVSIANSITQNLSLAKFLQDLKNTSGDMKACLGLTTRINEDIQYLVHLRNTYAVFMFNEPFLSKRQEKIISATQESLSITCRLFEGCGTGFGEGEQIPLSERMKWVLGNSSAFGRRTANLQRHHAGKAENFSDNFDAGITSAIELEEDQVDVGSVNQVALFNNQAYPPSIAPPLSHSSSISSVPTSPPSTHSELAHEFHERRIAQRHATQSSVYTLSSVPAIPEFKIREIEEKIVVDQNEVETRKISTNHRTEIVDSGTIDDEDDDPEAAFYRDLRRQEEERQRRLAARKATFL